MTARKPNNPDCHPPSKRMLRGGLTKSDNRFMMPILFVRNVLQNGAGRSGTAVIGPAEKVIGQEGGLFATLRSSGLAPAGPGRP